MLNRLLGRKEDDGAGLDIFGIRLPGPAGIACGNDPNAERYGRYAGRGLGFIEIGPITPLPEVPEKHRKLNSKGVRYVISRIQKVPPRLPLCAVLAHNASSLDEEHLIDDYSSMFSLLYDFVDAFTLNTTLRNVDGSRPLQDISVLTEVLDTLLQNRVCYESYKPILVQVAADTPEALLTGMVDYCRMAGIDGVGILPGHKSLETIGFVHEYTQGRFPVVGYCPMLRAAAAQELFRAGASLVAGGVNFRTGRRKNIQKLSV